MSSSRRSELEVDATAPRLCAWCKEPLPERAPNRDAVARKDSIYCSKSHRQAAYKFGRTRSRGTPTDRPLRLAYADPPYPTKSFYYRDHPDYGGEVDHAALVAELEAGFPDGWALSTSARALPSILRLCSVDVRVASWHRGARPTDSFRPRNGWEPVIYFGGRHVLNRRIDTLVHTSRARTTDPNRVIGAKPSVFCWWLFDLLGALPGDELVDLFPGSGGVARAWELYSSDPSPRAAEDVG